MTKMAWDVFNTSWALVSFFLFLFCLLTPFYLEPTQDHHITSITKWKNEKKKKERKKKKEKKEKKTAQEMSTLTSLGL